MQVTSSTAAIVAQRPTSVERLLSADSATALERFEGSPLLAEGKISLIGLDSVVERLGARWEMRSDQVYDFVERSIERQLGGAGYWLRVSDRDYLIVQPAASRFAAQAFCLSCLRELLKHFLGEIREGDLRVCEVTRLSAGSLQGALVDPIFVDAAAARESPPAGDLAFKAGGPSVLHPEVAWSPFVTNDGRSVRVSCVLEPVIQLKTYTRIGYRLARRVLVQGTDVELSETDRLRLSRSDIERIDLATISRGIDRLAAEAGAEQQLSLIIPVSFVSLSNQGTRALIAAALREAQTHVRRGIICEIVDIEGVPPSALLTAISLIRPFCLFVVGGVREANAPVFRDLKETNLQGASFDCPIGLDDDPTFLAWAKVAIGAAKRLTRSVLVYRLSSPRRVAMAEALGATHASMRLNPGGG